MKNRTLHIIAVLGVLFLIPSFSFAKSAPALSIEKMQFNGDYTVQVYNAGKWVDAGKLLFDKNYRERKLDLSDIVGIRNVEDKIKIRLMQKGGGAAHIDAISLGGSAPIKTSQSKDEEFLLEKLAKKDFDVIDAFGQTVELAFPADIKDMTLKLTARVEATEISKTPFQFPLTNLYKQMTPDSKFYTYKLQAPTPTSQSPFFKEFSVSGTGHPSGYTYGWVSNDAENLYVKIDFTGDNTLDGDKDYAKVYIKTGAGVKEFKVSVPETKWGAPSFKYTDKVEYQHKVYDFKIPLTEVGSGEDLHLAFAAYGTFAPPPAGEFNYLENLFLIVYDKWIGSGYDVYGKFVDSEGNEALAEFAIRVAAQSQYEPAVAYDGLNNRYLVVWHDNTSTYDIHGRFVNADGSFPGDAFVLSNAANDQFYPSVAYDSANQRFLVAWYDFRNGEYNIYGQLVNADGTLYNNNGTISDNGNPGLQDDNFVITNAADGQYSPSIAYDNANHRFLVVWTDHRNGVNNDIYGQIVNADGTLYNNNGTISDNGNPGLQDDNFVISNAPASQNETSVAYDSSVNRFLAVWHDSRNGSDDIYGQIVNADGTLTGWTLPGDNLVISNAAGSNKYGVAVASDNINRRFLAVWTDNRGGNYDIYGQFVNADGTLYNNGIADNGAAGLQDNNFIVKNASGSSGLPAVAFNSSYADFLVSFMDGANLLFAVVGGNLLPRTGQANCYDAAGKLTTCSNTGQDGEVQAGVAWPSPRFVNNGDGTITDKLTGLIWARDGGSPAFESVCSAGTKNWQDALTYVNCLKNNSYLGFNDWRLPNVNELASLVNYGESNIFTWLNGQGFINTGYGYWSSTTCDTGVSSSMSLSGTYGTIVCGAKTNLFNVMPVRGAASGPVKIWKTGQTYCYDSQSPQQQIACGGTGQDGELQAGVAWPVPRGTVSGGTVTDNLTGLMRTQNGNAPGPAACSPTGTRTWQDALNYIACLNTNSYLGFDDWRLPNVNELRSVVNYGSKEVSCGAAACSANSSWLNTTQGFTGVQGNYYWSSDSKAAAPDAAWFVNMTDGMVNYSSFSASVKTGLRYVWPVRGGQEEFRAPSEVVIGMSGPLSATVGTDAIYTINVTNTGPGTAYSLFLTDTLPAGATFISTTPSQGKCDYDLANGKVNCGIGNVPYGAGAVTAEVKIKLNSAGTNSNAASIVYPTDSFLFDNSASIETTVSPLTVSYQVASSSGTGGSISPNTPQAVDSGSVTSFTITADSGYSIASVTGCGGSLSGNVYITSAITADCTVTASFAVNNYALTVNKAGAGSGTVTGAGTYGHGSSVNVTATAEAGSLFTGWSVDCSGTASPTAVIVDRPKTCTATFAINAYALTVSKAGTGSGTVTGAGTYSPGSSASVTASADANSAFTGWGGDCSGPDNPAAVTMDSAKTCVANFAFSYYSLIINKTGEGTITPNPPGMSCTAATGGDCYKYNKGQNVVLIAKAAKDHVFKGWSSCTGTGPCKLEIDADKTVTASFEAVFPKISISLDGIELVPGADNYLEFDKVRVGRLKTKTLKVTNSGDGNLTISGQIEGADMDMFSRKMGGKVTIRPGKSYNIRVTFKPRSASEKTAELIINSNDPEMPSFRIDLGGEGFIKKK